MKEAAKIVALMFAAREAGHRAHLKTNSYAQHMALGGFYESVVDLADTFAETSQGIYGILDIPYETVAKGPIPDVLEHYAAEIDRLRIAFKKPHECALLNILDEVSALFSQTLYKLRCLK